MELLPAITSVVHSDLSSCVAELVEAVTLVRGFAGLETHEGHTTALTILPTKDVDKAHLAAGGAEEALQRLLVGVVVGKVLQHQRGVDELAHWRRSALGRSAARHLDRHVDWSRLFDFDLGPAFVLPALATLGLGGSRGWSLGFLLGLAHGVEVAHTHLDLFDLAPARAHGRAVRVLPPLGFGHDDLHGSNRHCFGDLNRLHGGLFLVHGKRRGGFLGGITRIGHLQRVRGKAPFLVGDKALVTAVVVFRVLHQNLPVFDALKAREVNVISRVSSRHFEIISSKL